MPVEESGTGRANTVSCYGKQIQFPDYVELSLRYLLEETRLTLWDIPGERGDAGKVVLVRVLVREGLLIVDR